jgi:hypothetical protein
LGSGDDGDEENLRGKRDPDNAGMTNTATIRARAGWIRNLEEG